MAVLGAKIFPLTQIAGLFIISKFSALTPEITFKNSSASVTSTLSIV